jgi:DNA-binding response OmpR family regulator
MRVLLVEDEPTRRIALRRLREQAYVVDLAADGESAIFWPRRPTTMPSSST